MGSILLGKDRQIRLAMACLIAGGHLLLEDLPGMGKTTLAEALARCFGLQFHRLHFTSDLLPADLTGVAVLNPATSQFRFQPGPLFCQVLLADEINRASPRTQSALLEAMASGRVSIEGQSHHLPDPFVVIASQNGLDQSGTSPLPESQLDRFLMRLSLGFPDREAEFSILSGQKVPLDELNTGLSSADLLKAQRDVRSQLVSPALIHYVLDLVTESRRQHAGLSPRAAQGLLGAAKAWAVLHNRNVVTPDDVQAVFPAVAEHRLDGGERKTIALSQGILEQVDALR
jgi:MoxR-like ATPase